MKVYVEYRMEKCTRIECPHFNENCPYPVDNGQLLPRFTCGWCGRKMDENDCMNIRHTIRLETMEAERVDIEGEWATGNVILNGKRIPMGIIKELRVDYGEGWKELTPWGDNDNE